METKIKPLYLHMYNRVTGPFGGFNVVHVRQDINKWIREDAEAWDMEEGDYSVEKLYVKIGEDDSDD